MIDLTGKIFTYLTVIKKVNDIRGSSYWECRCKCGNIRNVKTSHLTSGGTKSCGCYGKERATKHGQASGKRSPEYNIWASMLARCENPNNKKYYLYGERGICVSQSWHSFVNFFADMGERPSNKHSIDRYPNKDGNYELGNCRWATISEQNRNLRSNVLLEYEGRKQIMQDWATELMIDVKNIVYWLKLGHSFPEIYIHFTGNYKKRSGNLIEYNGQQKLLTHWAKELGIAHSLITERLKKGQLFSDIYSHYKNKKKDECKIK